MADRSSLQRGPWAGSWCFVCIVVSLPTGKGQALRKMGQHQMMTGESRNTAFIQASDATLVGAAKQGNSVAFDALAKRHEAKVFRVLFCITRNREDAQDAMQQSLQKALTGLKTFEGQSAFHTWLSGSQSTKHSC